MQLVREAHSEKGHRNSHHSGILPKDRQTSPEAVREQLEKLLASPHFAFTPRCQSLLRYLVEVSLEGNAESLKERNIGIEVFGRDAAYDTNADPVVRVAISEIRKKLAQYYFELGNQEQLRIELPTRSYAPEFSLPENPSRKDGAPHRPDNVLPEAATAQTAAEASPASVGDSWARGRMRWIAGLAAFLLVICVAVLVWRVASAKSPLETFWAPVVNSPNPVLLCLGQLHATHVELDPDASRNPSGVAMPIGAGGVYPKELPVAALSDSMTLADIAGLLRGEKKRFSISNEGAASYEDLQKGPAVLIGALNND